MLETSWRERLEAVTGIVGNPVDLTVAENTRLRWQALEVSGRLGSHPHITLVPLEPVSRPLSKARGDRQQLHRWAHGLSASCYIM